MQISTTNVPLSSKMSNNFIVDKKGSNTVPTILCVYYMLLEVLDTWSETRLIWW